MWQDRSDERLNRYKRILQASPLFYDAAVSAESKNKKYVAYDGAVKNALHYVLAPALCSYVLFVLNETVRAGKKRLYFLARDAYFMYETALIFCREFNIPVECRYLSCSRHSARIPMYHLNMNEALDYICRGGIDVTIMKILNRAGLDDTQKDEVLENLRNNGGLAYGSDEFIPYAELVQVRKALKGCSAFTEYTAANSKRAFPLFEGYLKQEGLADDVSAAFVDSGWTGSMQKVLNNAISHINGSVRALEGWYWGLYEMPPGIDPENYHCYYFSPGYNIREKVFFSNCLFEAVFSAPHGMTLGYRQENGVYYPVYADISKEQKCFMEYSKECYVCFARELAAQAEGQLARLTAPADKKIIYKLLSAFMGEPDKEEADAFGGLHFSDDVLDYRQQELAADLTQAELKANHAFAKILSMLGIKKGVVRESAWLEASAVRAGINVRGHLSGYRNYKRLLYMRKRHAWRKLYGQK